MSFQNLGVTAVHNPRAPLAVGSEGGKGGSGWEQSQRPEHYETHKHTAVCGPPPAVHHNSPLIPLRSAHQRCAAGQCTSTAASGGSKKQNNPGSQPQEKAPGGQ